MYFVPEVFWNLIACIHSNDEDSMLSGLLQCDSSAHLAKIVARCR